MQAGWLATILVAAFLLAVPRHDTTLAQSGDHPSASQTLACTPNILRLRDVLRVPLGTAGLPGPPGRPVDVDFFGTDGLVVLDPPRRMVTVYDGRGTLVRDLVPRGTTTISPLAENRGLLERRWGTPPFASS